MSIICENFCDEDKGLGLFKTLFGDKFIEAFYMPNTLSPAFVRPELADNQLSMVAIIASNVSMAALFIVGLVFFSGAVKWVIDSANDGEALGSKGGALGSVARPIFAVLMLMPTVSKFAVINIITLYFALWGHGFANKAYSQLIIGTFDTGVLELAEPDIALSQASDLSGAVFAGAMHQYCSMYARAAYNTSFSDANFGTGGQITPVSGAYQEDIRKDYKSFGDLFKNTGLDLNTGKVTVANTVRHEWRETGAKLNSSGPLCGEATFTKYLNPFPPEWANASPTASGQTNNFQASQNWAARRIAYYTGNLNSQLSEAKFLAAQQAYQDGTLIVNGDIPVGLEAALIGTDVKKWSVKLDLGRAEAETDPSVADPNPEAGQSGIVVTDGESLPDPIPLIAAANMRSITLNNQLRTILSNNGFKLRLPNDTTPVANLQCSGPVYSESAGTPTGSRGPQNEYEKTMCEFLGKIYAGGWINAAPAREKIKQYKMSAASNLATTAIVYSSPSFLATNPDDEEQLTKAIVFQTALSAMRKQAVETNEPKLAPNSVVRTDGIADSSFSGSTNSKDAITDKIDDSSTNLLFSLERSVIEFATGSGQDDNVDALTRMQTFGVGLNYVVTAYDTLKFVYTSGLTAASMGCSLTPGLFKALVYDCGKTVDTLKFAFKELVVETLDNTFRMLSIVAAYFSVFIPTMPFVFLLMAAIGWFIQVFQTLIGMPLWAIMHSIPGADFIGGQQHGYFALISLFFRPLIIIAGFFLAFELYDPVITLLIQGYFDMHMAVVNSNSSGGLFALFEILSTWTLHLFVLANLILAATYLIFGLIQELSDTTLEFMGTRVFAGFGNQETKSVAQGASGGGLREKATQRQNSKNAAQKMRSDKQQSGAKGGLKEGGSELQNPQNAIGGRSATGTISHNENGGAGTGDGDTGGGGAAADTNATATNNMNDAGGAGGGSEDSGDTGASRSDAFAIKRSANYSPDNTSSMISGVSDSEVTRQVAAYDKKNTFGSMGSKSASATKQGAQAGYSEARASGSGRLASAGAGIKAGLSARSQFKSEANEGHKERMEALRTGGDRSYNAMSLKHAQEGVAGTSLSNFDPNEMGKQGRFKGDSGQNQLRGFTGAIDQAKKDADMIPSQSSRSARA